MSIESKAPRRPRAKKEAQPVVVFSLDDAPNPGNDALDANALDANALDANAAKSSQDAVETSGASASVAVASDTVKSVKRRAPSTKKDKAPIVQAPIVQAPIVQAPIVSSIVSLVSAAPGLETHVASVAQELPAEPVLKQVDTKLIELARSVQVIEWMQMISQPPADPPAVRWTPLCWSRLDTLPRKQTVSVIPLDTFE